MNSQPLDEDTKITIITTAPQEPSKMYYLYSPYPPPMPTIYSNCYIWHLVRVSATPESLGDVSHLCHITSFFPPNPHHPPSSHPCSDHVTRPAPCRQTPQQDERHSKEMRGTVRKREAREASRREGNGDERHRCARSRPHDCHAITTPNHTRPRLPRHGARRPATPQRLRQDDPPTLPHHTPHLTAREAANPPPPLTLPFSTPTHLA